MSRVGPSDKQQPPAQKTQLSQSNVASQVPSKGRALKGMSFWEGLVHYVFFGWLVVYFTSKTDRRDAVDVTNEIMRLFPEKRRAEMGSVLYNRFELNELKQLENILQDPAARAHLLYAGSRKYEEVLNQFLQDPQKTKNVFHNFAQAQKLLNGRIDPESAFKINTFLLEQPPSFQQGFQAFLQEASKLQNKKPLPLAPSKETRPLEDAYSQISKQVNHPLTANLLQEIMTPFRITLIIQALELPRSYFHDSYVGVVPFALQYKHDLTERSIIISVSDPRTKAVRRAEIDLPKGISREKLKQWLVDHNPVILTPQELQIAQKFEQNSHKALANAISAFDTKPPKSVAGEIYLVIDQYKDKKLSFSRDKVEQIEPALVTRAYRRIRVGGGTFSSSNNYYAPDVTISTKKIENELEVIFTRNERSYTVRYPFKEGESQQELAGRIYSDHTLERDFMLASLILFEE